MARKAVSTDHYRLVGTYQRLRNQLLALPDDGRLDRQLSYWVLPTDRRLPIAFLDRPLRELLGESLDKLMATPGVGQKKIVGFFELLRRAAKATNGEQPFGLSSKKRAATAEVTKGGFDPTQVSEALWSSWCESVARHNFSQHKLGRLAPTLQALPTVIWHKPLGEYADKTLAQIRRLRTHGEKRIHSILEVFCLVHEAVATAARSETLELELLPRFVPPLERWLYEQLELGAAPQVTELRRQLLSPLVKQVEIDLGEHVARLVTDRLQIDQRAPTVKQQADALGVTRARVYQLLEDCGKVMAVRWPEGRWPLEALAAQIDRQGTRTSAKLMSEAMAIFYPGSGTSMVDREVELESV
jgi:hypothetical protein